MPSYVTLITLLLVTTCLSVSCIGLSAHKQSGYRSDSFTQTEDNWFHTKIQGTGPAINLIPLASLDVEGPPFKVGVTYVDYTGRSDELIMTSLTLAYADSREIIFSSSKNLISKFKRYDGMEPPKRAEVFHSIGDLVDPRNHRVIVLETTFLVRGEQGSITRSVSNEFTPVTTSGVDTFTLIHD